MTSVSKSMCFSALFHRRRAYNLTYLSPCLRGGSFTIFLYDTLMSYRYRLRMSGITSFVPHYHQAQHLAQHPTLIIICSNPGTTYSHGAGFDKKHQEHNRRYLCLEKTARLGGSRFFPITKRQLSLFFSKRISSEPLLAHILCAGPRTEILMHPVWCNVSSF
jgi:hypothetical protein